MVMSLYAINDTTLTALGDVVRSKSGQEKRVYQFDLTSNDSHTPTKSDVIVLSSKYNKLIFDAVEATNVNPNPAYGVFINFVDNNNALTPFFTWYNGDEPNHIEMNIQYSEIQFLVYGGSVKFNVSIIPIDENGNEFKYTPLEMVDKINGLMAIPETALTLTGDGQYRFYGGGWDWLIETAGDKITANLSSLNNTFAYSNIKNIPFDIYITSNCTNIGYTFSNAMKLETVPYIIGQERTPPTSSYSGTIQFPNLFNFCRMLREIPYDFFWKIIPNKDYWDKNKELTAQGQNNLFSNCCSLRELPDLSMLGGPWTSYYSALQYSLIGNCYALNKAVNIPVCGKYTSNAFSGSTTNVYRISDFTFEANEDGTPKTAEWKSQTVDLSPNVGWGSSISNITNYNSGITADKQVKDDATYQALKDDSDWFTLDANYSRYNHDSAVRTINSLPDCSATGTNTIKFKGAAGALTDGGAISTLTAEEIAVATAKGWTVSLA